MILFEECERAEIQVSRSVNSRVRDKRRNSRLQRYASYRVNLIATTPLIVTKSQLFIRISPHCSVRNHCTWCGYTLLCPNRVL